MGSFEPYLEMLPASQRRLWPELRPAQRLGLVLYGGTAIALRIGHRISVDFDFFSDMALDRETLYATFPFLSRSLVLQDQPNTLSVVVPDDREEQGVNVSFFGEITFGRIGEPEITSDGVVQVASSVDLLATKLKVILQRIEAKDYIDIASMVRSGVPLEQGLSGARQLYGPAFQPSECLKALIYFEGGDLDSLSQEIRDDLVRAVRNVRALPEVSVISTSLVVEQPSR